MDKDIAPELLEAIQKDFYEIFENNRTIQRIEKLIKNKEATYVDLNEYAIELGEILSEALGNHISSDTLPDGKMYYNIADRIFNPTMSNNYNIVAQKATDIQTALNHEAGLGIKGIEPKLNQDRIDGIIERVSKEDNFDDVSWILDEPMVNFTQSVVDDAIKTNAEFHAKSGLSPKIIRRAESNCCKWCSNLAGTYEYPNDVPDDVYRRHQNCRCTVEYDPSNGSKKRQNVWSKQWGTDKDAKLETRIERINHLSDRKFSNATPAKFSEAVKEAKNHVDEQDRWRVSAYDPDHYMGAKLHVTSNGSTTAVDKEGDIISVCRRNDDSIRGSDLIRESVKNGGIKLDSYAGNHEFYQKNGFEPVSWCEWDDKEAPVDWRDWMDKEPIIFYKYTGIKPSTIEDASEFFNRVSASTDYDEAEAVRDKLLGG